jgi:hypothetical protein
MADRRPGLVLAREARIMKPSFALSWVVIAACAKGHDDKTKEPPPPPPKAQAPLRDATGDHDIRTLISDLASAKACEQFKHHLSGLKDSKRPDTVTGQLWIRDCKITNDGTHVNFELSGNGWQWNETTKKKAGGTFVVKEYVKFGVDVKLQGALDIAYERGDHVVSVWYTPSAPPDVTFTPVGDVKVDRDGTWSSIIGGLGSTFGSSPEKTATSTAKDQGEQSFAQAFDKGFSITVNLCTNVLRFSLEKPAKGKMNDPDVGETHKVKVELQQGGVMIFGPYDDPDGMSLDAQVDGGSARLYLACRDQGELVAQAFLDNQPNNAKPVAAEVISGKAVLRAPKERCPVVVVARSIMPQPVQLSFVRPPHEAMEAKGGPILACGKP